MFDSVRFQDVMYLKWNVMNKNYVETTWHGGCRNLRDYILETGYCHFQAVNVFIRMLLARIMVILRSTIGSTICAFYGSWWRQRFLMMMMMKGWLWSERNSWILGWFREFLGMLFGGVLYIKVVEWADCVFGDDGRSSTCWIVSYAEFIVEWGSTIWNI